MIDYELRHAARWAVLVARTTTRGGNIQSDYVQEVDYLHGRKVARRLETRETLSGMEILCRAVSALPGSLESLTPDRQKGGRR